MKHTKLIILDFDHTVFNTTKFVRALIERFSSEFGIDEETFMKYRNEVKQCCVVIDIDTFVEKLPHPNKAAMHKAIHDVIARSAADCIFSDVRDFIALHLPAYDIVLSTHGDSELQSEKISHSHLPADVQSHISLLPKDKVVSHFAPHYKNIYFIDDKTENIDAVKKAHPQTTTYFLVRPEDHPYGERKSACDCADFTVASLSEVQL